MKLHIRHIALILTLLLLGGMANKAWAAKVTYHILTLPINASSAGMVSTVDDKRLEAIRVIVDNAATIELPAHFKSPLAENFKYWASSQVSASAATELYSGSSRVKEIIYTLDTSSETAEGTSVDSNCDIYVTYEYNASNTIAKLDGSKTYIIGATNGFLALNRGRNNRPAVLPRANVTEECLISEDFVKIDNPGISNTYWSDNNNKNPRASVEKQFHFQFQLLGNDPYNIVIRTAYDRDYTYIEKNENTTNFVYKWYKESILFTPGNSNAYLASDIDKIYITAWVSGSANPTNPASASSAGYFHGAAAPIWSSFALLNNTTETGYVFMGSRTYNNNGTFNAPTGSNNSYNYNYLRFDNANLTINKVSPADATKKYSVDKTFYEIKTVNFRVKTPFGNSVSASVKMSGYKIANNEIAISDIPVELKRKYCTFTKFYKDAELTQEITKYSQMTGTDVYVSYQVQNMPFKAITPGSYDADTWKKATWYELTDETSIEASGKKLKYTSPDFKNDGASGEFTKASEYAFIGDPYELRVVLRSATSGSTPTYVGVTGTPTTGTSFTASTSETAGYKWEIPDDDTSGSFLLRLYGGEGHWNWTVGNRSEDVTYGTNKKVASALTSNAQTVTLNISGLTAADGNYIKVTKGDTAGDAQVTATTPTLSTGIGSVDANGKATVTATIAANTSGADKTFTLTVTEYNSSNAVVGTATTITVTQGTTAFTGNTVEYSTASSTRVKVLELPQKTFTYKIVDKSGRIAVTASATQTIFSPLSLASIPSIIISPFILDETVMFYDSYTDRNSDSKLSRLDFHNPSEQTDITETPNADHDIFVTYTTTRLSNKPFKLSEDQTIFVRLNGQYVYYKNDEGTLKSTEGSVENDNYRWKLRGKDPYAMLLDNLGARTALNVSNQSESVTVPTDDNGTTASESRPKGAWVDVATITNAGALSFTTTRDNAQQFIAKSSARAGVYEVMVATGDGVDASTTYYNIGSPDENTVGIYSQDTYQAGDDEEIKFRLEENQGYVYHLIDKAKHELLTVDSRSPELVLPAEYQSPLVGAANYSYYSPDNITISGTTYTPTDPAVKLSNLSGLEATYNKTRGNYSSEWTNADEAHRLTATDVADMEAQSKKLTSAGDYYFQISSDYWHVNVTKPWYHDIYVTYVKNDLVTFNDNGSPYLLKFLQPLEEGYYLEDGKDKLTTSKIQAVYPYTNGDGNLNIYGTAMNEEQMNGGANTRPRWVWYFDCPTGYTDDPYHVRIRSRNTTSNNYTFLQTYAVHFYQDADPTTKHIVTGGCLPTIASETPTEYMILGTQGNYRLMTTKPIAVDLNGDGDTEDSGENVRHSVTSLEQYWKTYNMVKLDVLGISASTNAYSDDPETFVVPDDKRAELKTKLQTINHKYTVANESEMTIQINAFKSTGIYYFRIGTEDSYTYKKINLTTLADNTDPENPVAIQYTVEPCEYSDWEGKSVNGWIWHSYDAYANATRWNGYNNVSTSNVGSKVLEKLEHWFQTFDMGNGTFDIEDANIPPVLVLLDRHGWEIMRKPLPTTTYPYGDELNALRAYDSPMVKEYHFFNNATKASGCHKYSLRIQNKALRDEIKVDGTAYTSTSLASLPPLTADGIKDNHGIFQDFYVTYTVKEEYEKSYDYSFTDNGDGTFTETGEPSKFLLLQNGRFLKKENEPEKADRKSYFSKPIYEHTNPEGGNVYDLILSPKDNTVGIMDGTKIADYNFWYVGPNLDIDKEMGIRWSTATSGAEPLSEAATKALYANTSKVDYMQTTGFDPYNLQIRIADATDNTNNPRYITSHMTSAALVGGAMVGIYDSGTDALTTNITLEAPVSLDDVDPNESTGTEGHDHTNIKITNQTFMAVSDANGNMQLMPRFDHTLRVNTDKGSPYLTTLKEPKTNTQTATADNNNSMGPQTTFLVRPQVFNYLIIDNEGREALRYKRAGEYYPTITEHFKSPLATDFKYYFGNSAYTTPVSCTKTEYSAAESSFQKAATSAANMISQLNTGFATTGDYYFMVDHYVKVHVTTANDGVHDAVYETSEEANSSHYDEAESTYKKTATDDDDMSIQAKALTSTGDFYFKSAYYRKVYVNGATSTTSDGIYSDIANNEDISSREITGSFAEAGLNGDNVTVYVRYSYDEDADNDNHILQGKWFTIRLNDLDVKSGDEEHVVTTFGSEGTGVSLLQGTPKPATIDEDDKTWQWKFLQAPTDPSLEYYEAPDPYAIELYNRNANYDSNPTADPNKMGVPIKVNGCDHFSLLTHPSGGYALAVNGLETYNYSFLNGAAMTTSVAATTTAENRQKITVTNAAAYATAKAALSVDGEYYYKYGNDNEPLTYSYKKVTVTDGTPDAGVPCSESDWNNGDQYNFNVKVNALSPDAQLIIQDDVTHNYKYRVITNEKVVKIEEVETNIGNKLAVEVSQNDAEATVHHYAPYLPEAAQTPLLNDETDYLYYGSATVSTGTYTVIPATKLFTLYGLYDDFVYVRYKPYNAETTPYLVPNEKAVVASKVARGTNSNDVAMNIEGGLPYNIIWENDNMMQSTDDDAISDGGSHALDGTKPYVWYFEGGDPYALKIKHKGGKYVGGTTTLVTEGSAKGFMLLKKSGYDYGILQMTGTTGADANKKLTGYGGSTTTGDTPTKFIIFGLSVHDLIYHLIIAKTCPDKAAVPLPTDEYVDIPYMESESGTPTTKRIYGTSQRDLTSVNDGEGTHYEGEKYQLGETLQYGGNHVTYCYDAGTVSIGDALEVPSVFYRPNCTFDFYIEGVYNTGGSTAEEELNAKFKGLKLDNLMPDPELIDKTVVVNIVYQFDTEVATNTGLGFVTSTDQNLWYTLEALNAETPYLARYTNTQGLKTVAGRETRYTNDYLWTPVGDVYGFKMYNRYVLKNSSTSGDDDTRMMTTTALADEQAVTMAVPANGYEIYELTAGDNPGYFRIHPVANTGSPKYYVNQVETSLQLGTTPSEWTFGLDVAMLQPYYLGAGNVGGLTTTPKAGQGKSGKTLYEEALAKNPVLVTDLQNVVYNDVNIVDFADGYYRLHSQPGITGISPVRYASGYLHDTEKTGVGAETPGAIPMHFYSKIGVTGTFDKENDSYALKTGFTVSNATRGDIPVPATETDPSTIFRIVGGDAITNRTITNVTLSTQGLNVIGCTMGTGAATTYRLIDIGGGVVILVEPTTSKYLNFNQTSNSYDLKYSAADAARIDDVKWCVEPANNQGLKVTMNDGGDGYYYSTFCAPFDVTITNEEAKAYVYSGEWNTTVIHPTSIDKLISAGTPAIIRSTVSGDVAMTLPGTANSPSSCIFTGKYLEQMLAADASHDVYTFGLPFTTSVTFNRNDGSITAALPEKATTGVGFYINANPNKESDPLESLWLRNNRYVLHNKIYYREGSSGSSAPAMTRGVEFVPVIFDDEEQEELQPDGSVQVVGDGCIYDLMGRKVATKEQVEDGTWRERLASGIYILNGKKFKK